MDTKHSAFTHCHCLPYPDSQPGLYRYADGCCVRKSGDGACSLIPYDSNPAIPPHTESDFITHPDAITYS